MSTQPIGWGPDRSTGARFPEQGRATSQVERTETTPVQLPTQQSGTRRGVWGFQPAEAGWLQNLMDYQAFCRDAGRRPRARGQDPQERRLARWISSQRQDYRALILPAARKAQLDEHVPDWAD